MTLTGYARKTPPTLPPFTGWFSTNQYEFSTPPDEQPQTRGSYQQQAATPRQKLFLELANREAFYGGAAGGGKSSALLMAALEHVHVPGYSALLLRRTFQDLSKPGALMDRAREWLASSGARWNEQKKQWRWPSGAVVAFGYLENESDIYQYQGAEYQFIGFDELTQFTERQYTYLFSRLRRLAGQNVPLRMRSASNPGGIGAEWVQQRFIPDDWLPEYGRDLAVIEKEGRAFVPAKLVDNPHLDQESYEQSLAELDDVTRAQLLEGDWQVRERGNIFPMFEDGPIGRHVITWSEFKRVYGQSAIPEHWRRALGHDWGSTEGHPAVVSLIARSAGNSAVPGLYFLYWGRTFKGALVDHVAEVVKAETDAYHGAVELWRMSHEAKSESDTYKVKFGLPFQPMRSGKTEGIAQIRHMLRIRDTEKPHPFKPSLNGRPLLYLVVDDGEMVNPKTDAGLARHRGEFASYKFADTPPTQQRGQTIPVPYKWYDDAMDSMRGIFAEWGPSIKPMTLDEQINERLPETWQDEYLRTLPPPVAQGYYDARRETVDEIKQELMNRRRPANRDSELIEDVAGGVEDIY